MIEGKKINLRLVKEDEVVKMNELKCSLKDRGEYEALELVSEVSLKKKFAENGLWGNDIGKMIIIDKGGNLVGNIMFYEGIKCCDGYEIGCAIYKGYRGKGYGTEALSLFSAYLFELKPINRLAVRIIDGNVPSRKIAERCGYVYEGTMRKSIFIRGKYHDVQFFSILREECPQLDEVIK